MLDEAPVTARLHLVFGAAALAASPAIAATPAKLFVGSSPEKEAVLTGPVDSLTLTFAKPVEMRSITITLPDEREQDVVAVNYATRVKHSKAKQFAYAVSPPLTAPGRYAISYLIVGPGVPSLNGWIYFDIEAK